LSAVDGSVAELRGEGQAVGEPREQRFYEPVNSKTVSKKLLIDVPCVYLAYDLLRLGGDDLRGRPLAERRAALERLFATRPDRLSPLVDGKSWAELAAARETSRARAVEGLMLKRKDAPYAGGRHRGPSWKWKIVPETIDAVLTYAQAGSGKRANLLTDYTFGVWEGESLVTLAKAYSGLDNAEIAEIDAWLRAHTLERFGPVRRVEPALVFELAFDAIGPSKRHKSGVALRFPRIARWRRDKAPSDADTVERARALAARAGASADDT
jgi:DNA ligase-1